MKQAIKKVKESPELIKELYRHWTIVYECESFSNSPDEAQKNFAYNKYQHYKKLRAEICQ